MFDAGWSSPVARQAHKLKVVGSNPTPAPNKPLISLRISGAFLLGVGRNFQIGSILEADGGVSFCRNVQLTGVINRCAEICNSPGAAAE